MINKLVKITLTATLGFALSFTFSCSANHVPEYSSSSDSSPSVGDSSSSFGNNGNSSSSSVGDIVSSSSVGGVVSSSSTVFLCGGKEYNPLTQSCFNGSVISFCSDKSYNAEKQFCDTRDNKVYKYTTIGSQIWMAENLNYAIAGSKCGEINGLLKDENTAICDMYGRLYNWATAMSLPSSCNTSACSPQIFAKHQGVCPQGWHIPSNGEWIALTDFVYNDRECLYCITTRLKSTSSWIDGGGTDDYGFSALPGGTGNSDGIFNIDYVGYGTDWLSATSYEEDASQFYTNNMYYSMSIILMGTGDKSSLRSLRCIRD